MISEEEYKLRKQLDGDLIAELRKTARYLGRQLSEAVQQRNNAESDLLEARRAAKQWEWIARRMLDDDLGYLGNLQFYLDEYRKAAT